MNILIPIVKLVICSFILYSYYLVFLKDRQHHRFNRFYLLGLVSFSILAACIQIPVSFHALIPSEKLIVKTLEITNGSGFEHELGAGLAKGSNGIEFITVLIWIYGIGVLISVIKFIRAIIKLLKTINHSSPQWLNGRLVYFINHPEVPFTFLNRIFLPSNIDLKDQRNQLILQHECCHVKDRHGWDLLFLECCKIIFWFNPVFYQVRQELMTVHEFIADEHAAPVNERAAYAEFLLLHGIQQQGKQLHHYFNNQPIKRRILMLVKNHSNRTSYLARYIVFPMAAILFLGFVSTKKNKSILEKNGSAQELVVCIDAGHGGPDVGATAGNGVLESDMNLVLAKKIETLSANYPVKVILTRRTGALPGDETEVAAGLKKRVEIAKNAQANLFISLHMGAGKNDQHYTIFLPNPKEHAADYNACTRLGNTMVAALKKGFPISEQLVVSNKNIWVLNSSTIPAILLECGNISNEADLAFISDPANQEKLAKTILEGIVAYAGK